MRSSHGGAGSSGRAYNGACHRNVVECRDISGQWRLFQSFFYWHNAVRQQIYRHQRNRYAPSQAEQQPQKQQQERQQQQPPPTTPPRTSNHRHNGRNNRRFDLGWQRERGWYLIEAVQGIAIAGAGMLETPESQHRFALHQVDEVFVREMNHALE
ncbi:hypothetical protein D9M71_384280 [compost metagenome]